METQHDSALQCGKICHFFFRYSNAQQKGLFNTYQAIKSATQLDNKLVNQLLL
jgi:hypothetical protein